MSIEHESIYQPTAPVPGWALQAAIYGLFSIMLSACLFGAWHYRLPVAESPAIEAQQAARVEQRIDPNLADWQELTRLPGIGETLGKRIVEYRQEKQAERGDQPVFAKLEDLDPVRGIGPGKLRQMAPYVKFGDSPAGPQR